uniref:Putative plant transposon protein domain-containing protein n=1 Tax=Cucumis melo TaxID=3656 RepID=A0A9I9EG69_CUCME
MKNVVQRRIAEEVNFSDKHHSCLGVMSLIEKVGLSKNISNVGPFYPQLIGEFIVNLPTDFNDLSSPDYQTVHIRGLKFKISPVVINGFLRNNVGSDYSPSNPSNEVLASVLTGWTLSSWPVNGIHAVALSVKYVILHKVDIANWFSFSYASSVSVALGTFLYQICHDDSIDTGSFIYNQLLRHVGSFGVKIPIALQRFFSGLLLHLNNVVLTICPDDDCVDMLCSFIFASYLIHETVLRSGVLNKKRNLLLDKRGSLLGFCLKDIVRIVFLRIR